MPDLRELLLVPEELLALHQRLLDLDATASADLAGAVLQPLVEWLRRHNSRIDPDLCSEAAEDAILALIHNPGSYRPDAMNLMAYLRMSAQGDLQNILQRERRHHRQRCPWQSVELSPDVGKYLGREDDPSLRLRIAEQQQADLAAVPPAVHQGLTEAEARVLTLMFLKERKTSAYADALGIMHLPPTQQRKEVKRVKDRLTKRLERAGGER